MNLLDLLNEDLIRIGMQSEVKEEAIAELVEVLVRNGRVTDRSGVLNAVNARESKGTTGIGGGVAVPHSKHGSIKELILAMGTSRDGIEWDAVDDEDVYVVFLVLASPDNAGPHVACLAEIANMLQVPGIYEKLKNAQSPGEVMRTIESALEAQ